MSGEEKIGQMGVVDKLVLLDLTGAGIFHPFSSVSIRDWSLLCLLMAQRSQRRPLADVRERVGHGRKTVFVT